MYLKNFFKGLIIGIGFIIPGVSGSVLATVLGVYEEVLRRVSNFFTNTINNIKYLLPLCLGIILSVLLLSKLILYLLNNHLEFISYTFIGLILGCIPFLFKEIKVKCHKFISFKYLLLSIFIGIILFIIENNFITSTSNPSIMLMVVAGFVYSLGKLVPGISGAALLMLLGIYEYLLNILANPFSITFYTFLTLIPFILSFLISSIFIIKIINYLLTNYFYQTFSTIIGFVITSILFIIPNHFNILSIVIVVCSFMIGYVCTDK